MLALRMNNGHWDTGEEPERDKPLLAVGEPIIFESECKALEDTRSVDEIEPMSFQIRGAFSL
jgi:hypothetical protein